MDLINLNKITIGSDPEFFISKDKKIISSVGIIPGSKGNTLPVGKFEILKDNVLVEGNIPPTHSRSEFIDTMKELKDIINIFFNVKCISKNSHNFKRSQLLDDFANTFGCADYLNAWQNKTICAANLSTSTKRTAGFHIHIGYTLNENDFIKKKEMDSLITKAFDFFCVMPSRIFKPDAFRDTNYGELGSYREKPYGLEVRGLGGYFSKDNYLGWTYDRTIDTLKFCSNINNLNKLIEIKNPTFTDAEYNKLGIDLTKIKIK